MRKYLEIYIFILLLLITQIVKNVYGANNKGYKIFFVEKIEIHGNNNLSDRTIKKILLTKENGWFSHPVYYEDLFKDDLKSIIQLYHNHGYLGATISSEIEKIDQIENKLLLKIFIDEGEITVIKNILFKGNRIFSARELQKYISFKINEPFNESLLEKDNYALLSHYAKHGNIDAVIRPELVRDKDQKTILIIFNIDEGVCVRIKNIKFHGLEKIKPVVVEREVILKPEMVCDYNKMLESQHHLYQTGLFDNVSIKPILDDKNHPEFRDLHVYLSEKENGEINFGVGFGSYERFRSSVELFQNSFLGLTHQIGSRIRVSTKNQRFEFSYSNPWFFSTRTKYDFNTYIEHLIEPNYELTGGGGKTTLGRNLTFHDKLTFSYKYQDIILSNIKDTTDIDEKRKGNTRSLQLNYIHDSRDSQFNATLGSYLDIKLESAGGFLKGTNTFVKLTGEIRYFYQLKKSPLIILGIRSSLGIIENFGKSEYIPLNERFYAGGESSIRGYKRRQVGPQVRPDVPAGGKVLAIFNYEFRYQIYKKLGGTFFWDLGNVWCCHDKLNFFEIKHGIGFGFRYNSPLGIVRVDFGFKLDRQFKLQLGEIYFTLGQIF